MSKQSLTKEDKCKIFGIYGLGSKVYGDLQDDIENTNYGTIELDYDNFEFSVNENMQLVLKPLKDISDEDVLNCAELVTGTIKYAFRIVQKRTDSITLFNDTGYSSSKIFVFWFDGRIDWYFVNANGQLQSLPKRQDISHQYLISESYAVPLFFSLNHWANGKTAIELGIAIEHQQ